MSVHLYAENKKILIYIKNRYNCRSQASTYNCFMPENTIRYADVSFDQNGIIQSTQFNDIYFDVNDNNNQSELVFIDGNQLKQRFALFCQSNLQTKFVIAETGFGTGLNFILAVHYFLQAVASENTHKQLHFISTEKYPLTHAVLTKALRVFPQYQTIIDELLTFYPQQITGTFSKILFNGKVKLTVFIDDATTAFTTLNCPKSGLVDAIFLDGFSPSVNQDMWQAALFEQLARIAKPQASIATFTVAGFVRRGLQQVGFRVQKQAVKGKKSEILTGKLQQTRINQAFRLRTSPSKPQRITVIGGGIAAACACYKLVQAGIQVSLICKDEQLADGASSNAIGAVYPLLRQNADDLSQFYAQAFEVAVPFYQQIAAQGYQFDHAFDGVLDLSFKAEKQVRQQKFAELNTWPAALVESISAQTASKLTKITLPFGGLWMKKAGWVAPQQLVQQIFNAALATGKLKIQLNTEVTHINQIINNNKCVWQLNFKNQQKSKQSELLLLCCGAESISINIVNELPLQAVRGQVTQVKATEKSSALKAVLCHKGYITPANKGVHCIGATFDKDSLDRAVKEQDNQFNLQQVHQNLSGVFDWQTNHIITAKARSRCMTPDHFPIVGAMPDTEKHQTIYAHLAKDKHWRYQQAAPILSGLYVLTGLGARGLCSAPLLADILIAELTNRPYPVNDDLLFRLAPNRFVIRNIIRSQ